MYVIGTLTDFGNWGKGVGATMITIPQGGTGANIRKCWGCAFGLGVGHPCGCYPHRFRKMGQGCGGEKMTIPSVGTDASLQKKCGLQVWGGCAAFMWLLPSPSSEHGARVWVQKRSPFIEGEVTQIS